MKNCFALVDCNNFYASCERVFRPDLERRAIVVLSNNDGCVIARSEESKALGVPMGAPFFQIRNLIRAYNIKVFSSNFALYGDMSQRVMSLLQQEAKEVEVYSIDEAFLKYEDNSYSLEQAVRLRWWVKQCTGIPVSIGIAPSKNSG